MARSAALAIAEAEGPMRFARAPDPGLTEKGRPAEGEGGPAEVDAAVLDDVFAKMKRVARALPVHAPDFDELPADAPIPDHVRPSLPPCRAGDADACYRIAYALPDDGGRWLGLPWAARACEEGNPRACAFIGLRHEHGRGVPSDQMVARAYYERACELGAWEVACFNLARQLIAAHDPPRATLERAAALFEGGCERGTPAMACFNAALVADELGRPARPWYQRGCDLGDAPSCEALDE